MELKIEKGIPFPGVNPRPSGGLMATLRAMEAGDSILWPKASRGTLYACFRMVAGSKWKTRSADAENVRVWRME